MQRNFVFLLSVAALIASGTANGSSAVSSATAGQLDFSVEITGRHRTEGGGAWDEMAKQRLFKGQAQMQRVSLSAFDLMDPKTGAALEQGGPEVMARMLKGYKEGPYELWQSTQCAGETRVEDAGQHYNPIDPGFSGPVLLDVRETGRWSSATDSSGAMCSVQMMVNREGRTVSMTLNPAPERMDVQIAFGQRTPTTRSIAPFGWSAVGQTGRDVTFVGVESRFAGEQIAGSWEVDGGEPHDIRHNAVHQRDVQVVETRTRATWLFKAE